MSVIYLVTPFGTISGKDLADIRKCLADNGLEYPPNADQSRYPTQNEIEDVLRSFSSHEFESYPVSLVATDKPWRQASLFKRAPRESAYAYSEYVTLVAPKPPRDKDSPCDFYFSKGDENLNYAILQRVAYQCGPLLCITNGEYDAVIFHRKQPGIDPAPSFAANHHIHHQDARPSVPGKLT